jgi:hypothetical protein
MKKDRPPRVLCILGMHRSGTSCLTGSLQQGGLFLGKHHTWNDFNRKGNRENQDVVNLHESIFKANNLSWKNPCLPAIDNAPNPPEPIWEPQHIARAEEILAEYADRPMWGFKDPRALMLLSGWQRLVPDIEFIGTYRHPIAVAKSLASRPALPVTIEEGLHMWYQYNSELLRQYERKAFPIVCFDWSEEKYHHRLDELHQQFGLLPVPELERFYTSELHKQSAGNAEELPIHIRKLYEKLEEISAGQCA